MLIDATHWLIAFLIALSVHLVGLLWFEPAAQSSPPTLDFLSERIVVRLGPASGSSAETVALLGQPEETEQIEPSETADADAPASVQQPNKADIERPVAQVAAPPMVRQPLDLETLETPESKPVTPADEMASVQATVTAKPVMTADQTDTQAVEVIVTQPSIKEQAEVIVSSPAPTGTPDPAVATATTETVTAAPLLDEARQAQDAIPVLTQARRPADSELVTESEVTPAPVEPEQAQVAQADPAEQAQSISLTAVVVDLEEVDEVVETEQSRAVTPQLPKAVQTVVTPPREQVARAVTLEQLQGGGGVSARYAGLLKGWLQENMHYPRAARLAGEEGRAIVRFVIDRDGKVLSIRLEQGSGHRVLDREAVEMIERADPFPVMPVEMAATELELRVPIVFEIHDESLIKQIPPIYLE